MVTRGIRNNNPGNLKKSSQAWKGKSFPSTDPVFEQFTSMTYGVRALIKLLVNYNRKGYNTPAKIIQKYAPSSENDVQAYLRSFEQHSGLDRDKVLDFSDINQLYLTAFAICRHESVYDLSRNVFNTALNNI